MYKEDLVEIWEAKVLIAKGELKREKLAAARQRARQSASKYHK